MTKKEHAERNIGMTFDFVRQVIAYPDILGSIADGAELDFIEKDVPRKTEREMKGKKVARYRVDHIFAPKKG